MIRKQLIVSLFITSALALTYAPVFAQNAARGNNPPPSTAPQPAIQPTASTDAITSATIEQIMDQAVKNIARRYNLNDAQTRETHDLMKREVNRFLKEHESEVWPVLRELLAAQMNGKPPQTPEERARLGKAARPLLKLAEDAIFESNAEWRGYLDPSQLPTHDYDLAEMRKQFQDIDKRFEKLEKGDMPDDGGIFPPPPPVDRSPPRPRKPPEGLPEPEIVEINIFDNFVEVFIRDYQLDEGQADAARSILNEYKAKAEAFKQSQKAELAQIAAEEKAAREAHDRGRRLKAEKASKELLAPVYALYGEFENRLKGLLRTSQLQVYEARHSNEATVEERIRSDSTRAGQASTTPSTGPKTAAKPPVPTTPGQKAVSPHQPENAAPPNAAGNANANKPHAVNPAPAHPPASPAPATNSATAPAPAPAPAPKPATPPSPKEEPPPSDGSAKP